MRPHFAFFLWIMCLLLTTTTHADWVPVATVSETTTGHLCDVDDNGLDLFCGGNNPQLMANGGISSTSVSTTVLNLQGVSISSVLGAGGNFIVSGTTSISASNVGTLRLATAGSERLHINSSGQVGIGTTQPSSTLHVAGTIVTQPYNNGSSTSINWANGNVQYTSASCGSFSFSNMVDGGGYTLAVQGSSSGTCSFSHSGLTFRMPNDHGATDASTHTVYSFLRMGNIVYVTWVPNLS